MSKLKEHLSEAVSEDQKQGVLDAVNVALTNMTDSAVRLRMGRKVGKAFMGKQLKEAEKMVENVRKKLIDMSDFVLSKME
jgi:hypothetical protein